MIDLFYWWRHRNDTPEQRFNKAKQELVLVSRQVQESISNEPASKEVHDAYKALEDICNVFKDDCQG